MKPNDYGQLMTIEDLQPAADDSCLFVLLFHGPFDVEDCETAQTRGS